MFAPLLRVLLGILALVDGVQNQYTGNHPDWPRWCGKVYEPGYPAFDPGGQTVKPQDVAGPPLLHVQFRPRWSLFLESEPLGEFIVNAGLSRWHGTPFSNATDGGAGKPFVFSINLASTNEPLVQSNVSVNSTGNIFPFSLSALEPRLEPYQVVLYGAPVRGEPTFTVYSELLYLPRKSTGSVTKIDNLNGAVWFRNSRTKGAFEPFVGMGFYSSYDGFLGTNDTADIQKYADYGMNSLVPLTWTYQSIPAFDYMDQIDLRFMYDLREWYDNLTAVAEQVEAIKDYDSVYAYWSLDEPDGWQYPFNVTPAVYDVIRGADPYHPVAVVLNCQNYYFNEYSAGTDIIMADVYPIGINATFSKWGTPCNATLGDCGCDNCAGVPQDVPDRLDDLAGYEAWLGLWPKPKFHNPQSFADGGYWKRTPSPAEEDAMNALSLHHGARSVISWVYPLGEPLAPAIGAMARVVTAPPVRDFVVKGTATGIAVAGFELLDVAYWIVDGLMLVGVVNGGYADIEETVSIPLPNATVIESVLWGEVEWRLENSRLIAGSLQALSVSMMVVGLGS